MTHQVSIEDFTQGTFEKPLASSTSRGWHKTLVAIIDLGKSEISYRVYHDNQTADFVLLEQAVMFYNMA